MWRTPRHESDGLGPLVLSSRTESSQAETASDRKKGLAWLVFQGPPFHIRPKDTSRGPTANHTERANLRHWPIASPYSQPIQDTHFTCPAPRLGFRASGPMLSSPSAPHAPPPLARFFASRRPGGIQSGVGPIKPPGNPTRKPLVNGLPSDSAMAPLTGCGQGRGPLQFQTRRTLRATPGAPTSNSRRCGSTNQCGKSPRGAAPECNRNTPTSADHPLELKSIASCCHLSYSRSALPAHTPETSEPANTARRSNPST